MAHEAPRFDIAGLVAEHHADLYRYAYRLTGSVQDAEDLTQQTFLVAQTRLEMIRGVENPRAWLFTVLRHCFLKGKRKRMPLSIPDLEIHVDEIPHHVDHDPQIDSERLQAALDRLPDPFKLVLMLFYFEDYSYRQIAEELNLPVGTVMSRLSRAKSYLRQLLLEPRPALAAGYTHTPGRPGEGA